ncbi:MAG: sigma-70 family RNA polymerase sigma factor [Solibacillus sp.]
MQRELEEMMTQHSAHLLRLAYFYTKNIHAAEDIVQDVFIKMLSTPYEERGHLRSFLTRLTVNKSKDYLKSWAYRKWQFESKWRMTVTDRDHIIQQEERSAIGAAVLSLPLKYREPILLYYYEEMPVLEIAELLGLSDNTVKTRLRRAREQLKPKLAGQWEVLGDE